MISGLVHPGVSSLEDFDQYIRKDGPYNICNICACMKNKSITNVRCHIESKHFPGTFTYTCEFCGKDCFSKTSYRDHRSLCMKITTTAK